MHNLALREAVCLRGQDTTNSLIHILYCVPWWCIYKQPTALSLHLMALRWCLVVPAALASQQCSSFGNPTYAIYQTIRPTEIGFFWAHSLAFFWPTTFTLLAFFGPAYTYAHNLIFCLTAGLCTGTQMRDGGRAGSAGATCWAAPALRSHAGRFTCCPTYHPSPGQPSEGGGRIPYCIGPLGTPLTMRPCSQYFSRSWLQMSTLNTTFHPQRVAATCQPPAPAQRSSTLTCPSLMASHVCRRSCGIAWGCSWFAVGNFDDTCRFPAPSPCCSPTVSSGRSSGEACSAVHCGTCCLVDAGCPRRCCGRLRATWLSLCGVETYSMVSGFRVAMHVTGVVTLRRMFLSLDK